MTALTDADRDLIARARALAAITADEAKTRAGTNTLAAAYAVVFGEARFLLGEMAAIAERLGGEQ